MSSETPTWDKTSGSLGSTTKEFGGNWANLISDYYNGVNLALLDVTKIPIIGTLTRYKFEKLGLYDVDGSHYLSFSVDDIDTGANRKVKFRRMNSPFEEDYAVLEAMPQTMINKILDSRLNTIKHVGRHKYEIYKDTSTWYCRNTITGNIDSTNANPTTVLQYAVTNAAGAGILVKADTLLTTSEINAIDKPFLLEGEGSNLSATAGATGATIIKANFTGATGDAVIDCHNTGYTRQYFKNIVIDADAKVDYCIDSFANREIEGWLDNTALVNFKKSGIKMEACWQNSMINPTIMSGTSPVASSCGIEFVRGASPPCNTIRIRGGKISNNDINISCDGTNDVATFGTILEGFGTSAIKTFNNANANRFYGCSVEYAALSSKVTIDEAGNANLYQGLRFDAAHTAYNIITVRAGCRNLIFKDNLIQANNGSTTATIIIESGALNLDFKDNKQLVNTPLTVTITDNAAAQTSWMGNSFTPDKVRGGLRFGSNRLILKEIDANTLSLYADDETTRKNLMVNGLLTSVIRTTGSTDMIDLSTNTQIDFKSKNLLNGVVGSTITGIVDTNIASGAAIAWSKILKTGSVLGDISDTSLSSLAQYDLIMRNGSAQWGKLSKGSNSTALTTDASGVVAYTTITNAMLAGSITTAKLTDAANFALVNQANTFASTFLQTINGKLLVRTTSGSGDFEDITEFGVTDQTGDYLRFQNGTSTNAVFAPLLTASTGSGANGTASHLAMHWRGMIKPALDTGAVPVIRFEGRQNDGTTVDTRPILGISNVGTDEYLFYPTALDMTGNNLVNSIITGLRVNSNAKSANYTALTTDDFIPVDATSGNITITLPAVASNGGKVFLITKVDSGANTVIIDPNSSEQINGGSTLSLTTQYQTALVVSNGTAWFVNPLSGGGGATNLDALTDVDLTTTSPTNGDVLTYTTTGTKWIPAAPPGAGGSVTASSVTTFTNKTIDADATGNVISNIENADIKAAAAIATSKLADSANFILKTLDNTFGAHYQDFTKMTAPGNPGANDIRLYVDTSDTHLKIKNNAGTVVDLHSVGGGGSFTRENFEYLVYHNGTAYVALEGATGSLHATTSTTDAAAVINAAINSLTNGGKVYLGVGTFLTRTKINVKSKIHIQGAGEATIIKQDTTQNLAAVIESDTFTTLTGGGTNGGPHSVYLSDFVIEGNKANNTSTATDGIRYYGYNWHISNVHVRDCKGRGIYSEWDDDPSAPNATTSMEAYYSNFKIHDCDGDGWLNRGPHDWEGEHITIYDNGGHGYVQEYSAGLYDGGGFVDTLHIYANDGTYGAWIKGGTLHANRLTTESCANAASGVGGIGTYVNGGGLDCQDLWSFNQDKGIVFGSGSPSQASGIRAENNKVLGVEILMNDVKIEGVYRNNNNAGNTTGKGIKIGDAGGAIAVCHIAGYIASHKTTNIDWANAGNNGVIITPMICYTNATYPTVLTGSPNLNTCSVSIENHADSTPKDYRFSVVTYDQIQKSLFHRIDGQIVTGMEAAAVSPVGVGLLASAQLGGAGTTTHSFDNWEGRLSEFATSTTINTKAGLGHTTANIPIVDRRQNPRFKVRVKVPTTAGSRLYVGFSSATAIPASDTPLASADSGVLIGWDSADTQISYWANDGSAGITNAVAGAGTTISNSWHTYEFQFDEVTGACLLTLNNVLVATLTTNIPATDTQLCVYACVQCTAGSAARTVQMGQILLEKDFIP